MEHCAMLLASNQSVAAKDVEAVVEQNVSAGEFANNELKITGMRHTC